MPHYKLTYFNTKGRAELTRLIFAAAGVEFEDNRIEGKDWPALKPTTPWGSVPYLEVDGQAIGQSIAMARFVAREVGLAGKSSVESALADAIVDAVSDLTMAYTKIHYSKDSDEKKAEDKKKLMETTFSTGLATLEKHLKSNKNGEGFFVGDELTWADIFVFYVYTGMALSHKDAFAPFGLLKAHADRVASVPGIAKWLVTYPLAPLLS